MANDISNVSEPPRVERPKQPQQTPNASAAERSATDAAKDMKTTAHAGADADRGRAGQEMLGRAPSAKPGDPPMPPAPTPGAPVQGEKTPNGNDKKLVDSDSTGFLKAADAAGALIERLPSGLIRVTYPTGAFVTGEVKNGKWEFKKGGGGRE